MYYYLHDYCKLITGKSRGAIYDLKSGKVYSVNESALSLLKAQLKFSFRTLAESLTPAQIIFFDTLTQKGLGSFYLTQPASRHQEEKQTLPLRLDFVWLELTAKCNNRCLHCYTNSSDKVAAEPVLALAQYLNLIHEIRSNGCTALQLIGGEPLLYPHWRELIKKAFAEKYEFIEIFTNATLLNEEIIDFLNEHNVHIATTIYADNAEIHDKVTQNQGSFLKTTNAINTVIKKNIPLRIASILMKANENEGEKIMNYCTALGVEALPPDIIRPTGRGENQDLLPTNLRCKSIQPPFYISDTDFKIAQLYHPCLAGKLAITPNGNVYPCIFARNNCLGNITSTSLTDLLSSKQLQDCWHTTKDKIKKCKDCEYRYACPDCRPAAQNVDKNHDWLAAPPDCSYNPYTGIWAQAEE